MNDPIVSPWLVYLIMQVGALIKVLGGIGIVGWIPILVGIVLWIDPDKDLQATTVAFGKRMVIWLTPFYLLCMLVLLLAPRQNTIIAIIAAKHITPQTVEQGVDVAKQVKNEVKGDVLDIIKELTNNDKGDTKE